MKKIIGFTGSFSEFWLLQPLYDALSETDGVDFSAIAEDEVLAAASAQHRWNCASRWTHYDSSNATVIILGDRREAFEFAHLARRTAYHKGCRIAHFHGGECTTAVIDDFYRDAITLMSSKHFVATVAAERRVRQLLQGKQDRTIYHIGALGYLNEFDIGTCVVDTDEFRNYAAVLFNPVGDTPDRGSAAFRNVLEALRLLGVPVVFFEPCNDEGKRELLLIHAAYSNKNPSCQYVRRGEKSRSEFLCVLNNCRIAIGNSSAIIYDTPIVRCPAVLVGNRQDGRQASENIVRCDDTPIAVVRAIELALKTPVLKILNNEYTTPFGVNMSRVIELLLSTA